MAFSALGSARSTSEVSEAGRWSAMRAGGGVARARALQGDRRLEGDGVGGAADGDILGDGEATVDRRERGEAAWEMSPEDEERQRVKRADATVNFMKHLGRARVDRENISRRNV